MSRDPDEIAFEKAYPGVRATSVTIGPSTFDYTAMAPPATLMQVGLVSRVMLDAIPPCGHGSFGPKPRNPKNYAPVRTQLYRKKSGDIQIRQFAYHEPAAATAFCAKLGVALPQEDAAEREANARAEAVRQASAELEGTAGPRFLGTIAKQMKDQITLGDLILRERAIGRRQTPRRWAVCGPTIFVDWPACAAR
jgi:hypothetical protein